MGNNPVNATDPSGLEGTPNLQNLPKDLFRRVIKLSQGHTSAHNADYSIRAYAVPFVTSTGKEYWAVLASTFTFPDVDFDSGSTRYHLVGVAPGMVDPYVATEALATDEVNLGSAAALEGALEFALHFTPGGAAADYAAQGNYKGAGLSLIGDAASLATAGAGALLKAGTISVRTARHVGRAAAAVEGTLGIYRTAEGTYLMSRGEGGAGEIAEGLLRLLGVSVSLAVGANASRSAAASKRTNAPQPELGARQKTAPNDSAPSVPAVKAAELDAPARAADIVPTPAHQPARPTAEKPSATGKVDTPNQVPDNPYFTRIDPAIPGSPDPHFSIDTKTFSEGKITSKGGIRNAKEFWIQWQGLRPESLSKSNRYLIENCDKLKVSPRIDDEWIEVFPEHTPFKGRCHHHLDDFGRYAIPVPARTHVGSGGIWHAK